MQDIVYTELTEEQKLNPKVRGKIINEFAPLIKYIASRIAVRLPPHIDLNDLINAGVIGLIDAIEKFDAGKQVKLKTYAEFRIKGAILDDLRSMDCVPRSIRQKARILEKAYADLEDVFGRPATDNEVARELNLNKKAFRRLLSETAPIFLLSLDDLGEDEKDPSRRNFLEWIARDDKCLPSSKLRYKQVSKLLVKLIRNLPKNESLVLSLYYYDEMTMKEISYVMKNAESRVSQIHTKATLRLRGRLARAFKTFDEKIEEGVLPLL
jgi:RNA polymerase sigma factor FliA